MMDMNKSLLTCLTWILITAFIFVGQVEIFLFYFILFCLFQFHLVQFHAFRSAMRIFFICWKHQSCKRLWGYCNIWYPGHGQIWTGNWCSPSQVPTFLWQIHQSNKWSVFQKSSIFAAPKRKRLEGISIRSTNQVPLAADTGKDPIISIKLWLEAKVKMSMLLFHSLDW